jgi:hypothetical protein
MKAEGRRKKGHRSAGPFRASGRIRLAAAIALIAAVVAALVAWNRQEPDPVPPVVKADRAVKPAPSATTDPRDAARDRPDRERTSR